MDQDDDMIFGFLEENGDLSLSSYKSSIIDDNAGGKMDEEGENNSSVDERKAFWESKHELLQATLYRTTSLETTIREATNDALRVLDSVGVNCSCMKMVGQSCKSCRQTEIAKLLQIAGFSCVLCKSRWRSSTKVPAGNHTYLQVVQNSGSKKRNFEVVIELNFRAEFEMARACEEYNHLIQKLPEVYVGKIERLRNVIKIMCSASKKCMKERKMHMAPWRKEKYMQAKWRGVPLPGVVPPLMTVVRPVLRRSKPTASMLSLNLADSYLPGLLSKGSKGYLRGKRCLVCALAVYVVLLLK